jgi:hypothetical protein
MKAKNIILDLDNTIICAVEMCMYDAKEFEYLDKNLEHADMDDYYRIYARPYLQEFLDHIFANFNVSVFTAASKSYALFIVDKFILRNNPSRKLTYMFHSYHTQISEAKYNYIKDLRLIWSTLPETFTPNNTVIVDDLKQVKKANRQNCINVKAFEVFNENKDKPINAAVNDDELLKVIKISKLYL